MLRFLVQKLEYESIEAFNHCRNFQALVGTFLLRKIDHRRVKTEK